MIIRCHLLAGVFAVVALSCSTSCTRRTLVFEPVAHVDARRTAPQVSGGTEVDPGEFPGSFASEQGCSLTIVGPKLALTAAHCVEHRLHKIKIRTPSGLVKGTCTLPATFPMDRSADWALCRLEATISRPWAVVNQEQDVVPSGTELVLTGFGCDEVTGEPGGIFRKGIVRITQMPTTDQFFLVEGDVRVCSGDSGGAAYVAVEGSLLQAAVTSRKHPTNPRGSLLSSLTTAAAKAFLRSPLADEQVAPLVCGVNLAAAKCR